jgi:hypothetical protein
MSLSRAAVSSVLLLVAAAAQPSRANQASPAARSSRGCRCNWQAALAGALPGIHAGAESRPDCFSVYASVEGGALLVNFTPGRPLPEDANLRGGGRAAAGTVLPECPGGELLRRNYSR